MAIVKTTEAKLELKAARKPAPHMHAHGAPHVHTRGAPSQHTDDAALLYTVGGTKVVIRQGDDRVELDAAQLVQLGEASSEILKDINQQ
jgi:hypothetical protein